MFKNIYTMHKIYKWLLFKFNKMQKYDRILMSYENFYVQKCLCKDQLA